MYDRKEFQSTLPREERHKTISSIIESKYFNPRSHERSDRSSFPSSFISCISIHAPTRGATGIDLKSTLLITYFNPRSHERSDPLLHKRLYSQDISIHAPTRGATWWGVVCTSTIYISIHAPTRGATPHPVAPFLRVLISIHAPTRGATHYYTYLCYTLLFQSTLPREERHGSLTAYRLLLDFNPRSHERSDQYAANIVSQ